MPAASAAAASTAPRTPFSAAGAARTRGRRRESGDAGTAPVVAALGLLDDLFCLALRLLLHPAEHRKRQALAREEDQADPNAHGRFDRLQADPEREALRIADAVLAEGQRDRRLDEAEVARPE